MTKLSVDEVLYVAKLSNILLQGDEVERLKSQLEETITYISRLNEVDTTKVEPTNQVNHLKNVYRGDTTEPSLEVEKILSSAKNTRNGFFVVDGVLNKD
jgi:aspartyl-tRNA(Asn)/glutamyl-tRNA(Gln) amidotransferase subunit C